MAEGDTVLRLSRRLGDALSGEEVEVRSPNPRGRVTGIEQLDGMRLVEVGARGKNLLLGFGGLVLHSHLGMSGSWHLYRRGARWSKPERAAWAVLAGAEWSAVQFGGPTLRVLRPAELKRDPVLSRLGADILAPQFDIEATARALRSEPGRVVGDALLDQRLVAGIGNIFKSESCFAARIDPRRPVGELTDAELKEVLAAARLSMQEAVSDGQRPHAVYRRAGRPCPRCQATIASFGQGDANRRTYWCPNCQQN